MDKKDFAKWFYILQLAKGKPSNKDMAKVWYELLKDLPANKVKQAFKQCTYSADDFPTAGKMYEIISKTGAAAMVAWCEVLKCACDSKDPGGIAGDVIKMMGGINKIGYCENEYQMDQMKRQFLEIYESKFDALDRLPEIEHKKPKQVGE